MKRSKKNQTVRRMRFAPPRMKKSKRKNQEGISRRDFMKYTAAGAGMMLGMGKLLTACGGGGGTETRGGTEKRTYFFNLSHIDFSAHDILLVAGNKRQKLELMTPEVLEIARNDYPILRAVPDQQITHHISDIELPADSLQLCYLQRVSRTATDGSWDLAHLFYHLPTAAVLQAQERRGVSRSVVGNALKSVKWGRYGITTETRQALADPVGEDNFKDTTDQAVALVFNHPEILSGEPNSAAHIQTNIIQQQPATGALAQALASQGPATPNGGWATQTPVIDPDTNQPFLNSQGQTQYIPVWSQTTNQFAGQAILPSLGAVKNDTTLGVNITNIDPTTITTNDPNAPTNGRIWTLHDGMPTVHQASAAAQSLQASGLSYKDTNQSPGHGYDVSVTNVDQDANGNINITFQAKNWYVRHLGLYIRYLDANGQPIPLANLENEIMDSFPLWRLDQNGASDAWLALLQPELVILGIPVKSSTTEQTFPLPKEASSALILAGGLGTGDNPYPDTLTPGVVVTAIVNLALPTIFLAFAAASAYASYAVLVATIQTLQVLLTVFVDLQLLNYDDPKAFLNIAQSMATILLSTGAKAFREGLLAAIGESTAMDAIPLIGGIIAAIAALGLVATLTETITEVALSPKTYVDKITFTHNIEVTINHDPMNTSFPAVATHFDVTAIFDNGTPTKITQQLSGTVSAPITVTFSDVPFGGKVGVSVGFYSDSGFLAGQGSVGPVDNVSSGAGGTLNLEITIMENLVPLTENTLYSHKEIVVLDGSGNHEWMATTTPPSMVDPEGQCESVDGQLCSLTGITVSTINGDVGYSWQAYNQHVSDCVSGSVSQLHQFANLSITQNPESGRLFSGCGFSGPVRIVYDLLGKQDLNFYLDTSAGKNLIRQIQLVGTPSFDGPNSNRAWGRLNFDSDAMLLHPIGKIISVNSELNKIEVLELPDEAVADDEAPRAQAYSGKGIREGLVDGPTLAALRPDGTILILETENNRIQAFDLEANPVPYFKKGAYHVPLQDQPTMYLDMAVEYKGFIYVLSFTGQAGSFEYRLDIYTPEGDFLARTTGVNAARLAVNYWRDIYTENYEVLKLTDGSLPNITEPSVSHWIPSTP